MPCYRQRMARANDISTPILIAIILVASGLLALDRQVLRPMPRDAQQMPQQALVFLGDAAQTDFQPGIAPDLRRRAENALAQAAYHAAYAEGPGARHGLWTGAHDADTARRYALAACGAGCRVVAERRPRNMPQASQAETIFLAPGIARRLGDRWPFTSSGHVLAIGGAGAWGTGHGGGRSRWRQAVRLAIEECRARLAAEKTPPGIAPEPCRYMSLRDLKIEDLRPEVSPYPAAYTVGLAKLVEVPHDRLRLLRADGQPVPGLHRYRAPDELYGAKADNGAKASGVIRGAGWPAAAVELAMRLCQAERRFDSPPCKLSTQRMPANPVAPGTLAVTPEVMAAFRNWQKTDGAGAFAISALGAWGTSHGYATGQAARQKAADWCAYYARRGNRAHMLRRAFIDQPPCRIVAERLR